jgi:Golgi nucleoside diphosphatase
VTASGAERPKKPHYLPAQPYLALNRAVGSVNRGLDSLGTFLVGSCLERADFRDVDVRTMMTDEAYDRLFPGGESGTDSDAFWSLLCESIGAYLAQATGLPIDYQIQRMTEANAMHPGLRNALSSAGGRLYPGELPSFVRERGKNA